MGNVGKLKAEVKGLWISASPTPLEGAKISTPPTFLSMHRYVSMVVCMYEYRVCVALCATQCLLEGRVACICTSQVSTPLPSYVL